MEKNKNIITIVIVLVVLIVIALLGWWYLRSRNTSLTPGGISPVETAPTETQLSPEVPQPPTPSPVPSPELTPEATPQSETQTNPSPATE